VTNGDRKEVTQCKQRAGKITSQDAVRRSLTVKPRLYYKSC